MKVTWRVLYIIYAAILLLVVGSLAKQHQEQLYFENEGREAINSEDELEKFYFFYGSLGYHLRIPTMIKENPEFIVAFFEIYRTEISDSILYIMLYPKDDDFDPSERILYSLKFNYGDNLTRTYEFDQFRNLQMYVLVDSKRQAELKTSDIQALEAHTFTVMKKYATVPDPESAPEIVTDEFEFIYSIQPDDLVVKKAIDEYGLDDDLLNEHGIWPKHHHSLKKYSHIYYLSIGGALILIALGAYFFFFFRKGDKANLGSRKPSKTFKDFGYQNEEEVDPLADFENEEDS